MIVWAPGRAASNVIHVFRSEGYSVTL